MKKIKKALRHVRKYYPTVTTVVFNRHGRWNYCDDDFNSPIFDDRIEQSILNEALDSVPYLPFIYQMEGEI